MKPLPRQILLGVVGPGAEWEAQYAPLLNSVTRKTRVVAQYQYPQGRSTSKERGAGLSETGSSHHGSLRHFFNQPGLRGAFVLGERWLGPFSVQLALGVGCSAYFTNPPLDDLDFVSDSARIEQETGILLMPEFRLRFTPATLRLRELIATQLGPVNSIQMEVSPTYRGAPAETLVQLIDWCFMLWPSAIEQVQVVPSAIDSPLSIGPDGTKTLHLRWEKPGSHGRPRTASITLPVPAVAANSEKPRDDSIPVSPAAIGAGENTDADSWPVTIRIECEQGVATILDACHVDWSTGDTTVNESLRTDRTAVEVSLDLFTRRLAGGLVPVPNFSDLARALTLLRQLGSLSGQ